METLKNETEDVLFRKAIKKIPIGYQDPSGKSLTSLIILHSKSPLKHTRLVLQMGYSTTTPDKNGWTPLHHTGLYSFQEYRFLQSGVRLYAPLFSGIFNRLMENVEIIFW